MSYYSDYLEAYILNLYLTSGINSAQRSFTNVGQGDTNVVTHISDEEDKRISQVFTLVSGTDSPNVSNTTLDFDLEDEADFVQEDSVNGTDFIDGTVTLSTASSEMIFVSAEEKYDSSRKQNDWFGKTVSISGDVAVVGDRDFTGASNVYGAAYVFKTYDGGATWTEKQKLNIGSINGSSFGSKVLIQGDIIIVGAGNYVSPHYEGRVYVYRTFNNGESFSLQQTLSAPTPRTRGNFGYSISISGDLLAIGEPAVNTVYTTHRAYVYKTTNGGTTWTWQQTLTASDPEDHDEFGTTVSIDGNYLAVSAPLKDTVGSDLGAVYVFKTADGGASWTEKVKLLPTTESRYGIEVELKGDVLAVGAWYQDYIWIYKTSDGGESWPEVQKPTPSVHPTHTHGAGTGRSIAILGNYMLIAAPGSSVGTNTAEGSVSLWKTTDGGATWIEIQSFVASTPDDHAEFGYDVAMSGDFAIIGEYKRNIGVTWCGAVEFFDLQPEVSYPTSQPYYITTSSGNNINLVNITEVNSCSITVTIPSNTTISGLVSFDARATWSKWGGSSWATHTDGLDNLQTGNTIAEIQTGLNNLTITDETYLDFAFDFASTNSSASPSIDQITLNYDEDGLYQLSTLDYTIAYTSATQTSITKNSSGTENIKVNIIL